MNHDLIMNPTMPPFYISTTNMIMPLVKISFNEEIKHLVNSLTNFMVTCILSTIEVMSIMTKTFVFIAHEAFNLFNENLSIVEKILFGLCVFNLISLFFIENTYDEKKQYIEILKTHEKDLNQLKIQDILRDEWEKMWSEFEKMKSEEYRTRQEEISQKMEEYERRNEEYERKIDNYEKKIKNIENKLKQMKKNIDEYN